MEGELRYVYSEVGSMVLQQSERARFLVLVEDGPPATLRMIRNTGEGIEVTDHELGSFGLTGSFSRNSWRFTLVDGTEYIFDPLGCSCGAGKIAYHNPAPGFLLTRVRTPEWLEAS